MNNRKVIKIKRVFVIPLFSMRGGLWMDRVYFSDGTITHMMLDITELPYAQGSISTKKAFQQV